MASSTMGALVYRLKNRGVEKIALEECLPPPWPLLLSLSPIGKEKSTSKQKVVLPPIILFLMKRLRPTMISMQARKGKDIKC